MHFNSNKILIPVILAAIALSVFIYGRYIEPYNIHIREVKIDSGFIPPALKGKNIVHLSDLHMAGFGKNEQMVLDYLGQNKPDLIFLTGDYIQWGKDNQPALNFLSQLKSRYGVFAVMGDYDYSGSRKSCLFCHEKDSSLQTTRHEITMLRNSTRQIMIDNQVLQIAGIDDQHDDQADLTRTIDLFRETGDFCLILSHSPLAFDQFKESDRVLLLAGDTHGGQIKLPKWIYRLFGYEKMRYSYGLFQSGEKRMYVTSGVGTSHFRFRFLCPPEITLIRF